MMSIVYTPLSANNTQQNNTNNFTPDILLLHIIYDTIDCNTFNSPDITYSLSYLLHLWS